MNLRVLLAHCGYAQRRFEDIVYEDECELLEHFGHEFLSVLQRQLDARPSWLVALTSNEIYRKMVDAAGVAVSSGCGESFGPVFIGSWTVGKEIKIVFR